MKPYDYSRRQGVKKISWEDFGQLARQLTERIATYSPQMIIGIARAGLFPATAVACMLRCEMYPIRLTRRLNDKVCYEKPVWKVEVPSDVQGKLVVLVDEISDTGETLQLAAQKVRDMGALSVITASLVSHSWAKPQPEVTAMISDALVIFPWDSQVLESGNWQLHPEIQAVLNHSSYSE